MSELSDWVSERGGVLLEDSSQTYCALRHKADGLLEFKESGSDSKKRHSSCMKKVKDKKLAYLVSEFIPMGRSVELIMGLGELLGLVANRGVGLYSRVVEGSGITTVDVVRGGKLFSRELVYPVGDPFAYLSILQTLKSDPPAEPVHPFLWSLANAPPSVREMTTVEVENLAVGVIEKLSRMKARLRIKSQSLIADIVHPELGSITFVVRFGDRPTEETYRELWRSITASGVVDVKA